MSESLEDYYRTNGLVFGGVDILCLGRTATQTIAKTLLGIFSGAREPTGGRSPIHSIAIVYPSASLPSEASAALSAAVVRWAEKNADLVPEGRDPSTWIELVPVDFQASSVTGIAENLGPNGLLIVLRAADFRGGAGETETTAAIPEDVWVPQLFALARDLLEVARTRKLQVVLEAGQDAPSRREHQELLQSLDGVGILGAAPRPSEEYLARNLARWDELLHQGRIGVVLREVDAAPELSEQEKQVYRIQLLHRAGLLGQALEALEQLQQIEKMPALLLARLSRIASTGGADFLATRLLAIALPGLQSIDELIMGLAAADELDDDKLGDEIAARLEAAFPRHPAVTSRRRLQLRRDGRFSELAENLRNHPQDESSAVYYSAIATALAPVAPAYELARADLDKQFTDRRGDVSLLLARHAMSRQRVGTAVRLLVPLAADQRVHASLLLDAMEMLILGREVEDDAEQLLRTALISTITYLSNNPKGASFRVRLTNLLSFELAGHSSGAPRECGPRTNVATP